jgi:hypothetical protein
MPLDSLRRQNLAYVRLGLLSQAAVLDEVRPRWENNRPTGPDITSLTLAGRATALAFLYAKATAPRTSLRS